MRKKISSLVILFFFCQLSGIEVAFPDKSMYDQTAECLEKDSNEQNDKSEQEDIKLRPKKRTKKQTTSNTNKLLVYGGIGTGTLLTTLAIYKWFWPSSTTITTHPSTTTNPHLTGDYVVKVCLQNTKNMGRIFFIGDLHGCRLPLDRILNELRRQKVLEDNKLQLGNFMVFLGDYHDRGSNVRYVLDTIAELKRINPNSVFALQGNMDERHAETANFPCAIYFRLTASNGVSTILHCSHGGLPLAKDWQKKQAQAQIDETLIDWSLAINGSEIEGKNISPEAKNGYLHMDFTQKNAPGFIIPRGTFFNETASLDAASYFYKVDIGDFPIMPYAFRGHQHGTFGCKMINTHDTDSTTIDKYGDLSDFKTLHPKPMILTADSEYVGYVFDKDVTPEFPIYTLSAAAGADGTTSDKCKVNLEKECFAAYRISTVGEVEIYEKK